MNRPLSLTADIRHVERLTSKNGNEWAKVKLHYEYRYPSGKTASATVSVSVTGRTYESAQGILVAGQPVVVQLLPKDRDYNGRTYSDIELISIATTDEHPKPPASDGLAFDAFDAPEAHDDIPF